MTQTVQELLERFDHLSEAEQREALAELLRRSRSLDVPVLSDEELIHSAEELFLELDRGEEADDNTDSR